MADVVVVGGGIGGLAAAARLGKLGHRVTLCEGAEAVGGLLRPVERDGFSWDTVGSLTLPAVLRDLFRKSGRPIERYLELRLLTPARRMVFPDGATVDLPTGSRGEQARTIEAGLGKAAADEWAGFVDAQADRWQVLRQQVLEPFAGAAAIADPEVGRALAATTPLSRLLQRSLDDPRLRTMAAHGSLLAGADPRRLPGFAAVEPYVERTFGLWQVVGGTDRLVDALATRLSERRVDVRLGFRAAAIEAASGRVTAVRSADGERLAADIIVTDLDVRLVLGRLLPSAAVPEPLTRLVDAEEVRTGPSVTYLGLRGDLPDLPSEVVWYGDPLVVLRHRTAAPAGHCAVTLLCQPKSSTTAPTASSRWSRIFRPGRSSGAGAAEVAVGEAASGPATSDRRGEPNAWREDGECDVLEVLAARGLDLRDRVAGRIDRSATEIAEATGGSPYGLDWVDARTAAARAGLVTPLPGLYCLGAGLPLPTTVPYLAWHAATVADAIGKP